MIYFTWSWIYLKSWDKYSCQSLRNEWIRYTPMQTLLNVFHSLICAAVSINFTTVTINIRVIMQARVVLSVRIQVISIVEREWMKTHLSGIWTQTLTSSGHGQFAAYAWAWKFKKRKSSPRSSCWPGSPTPWPTSRTTQIPKNYPWSGWKREAGEHWGIYLVPVECWTKKPCAILTWVWFPGMAREFAPRVNIPCWLSYHVHTLPSPPPSAITCTDI